MSMAAAYTAIALCIVSFDLVHSSTVPARRPRPGGPAAFAFGIIGDCTGNPCSDAHFSYDRNSCFGPDKWHEITQCWHLCESTSTSIQSPVGLKSDEAIFNPFLSPIYIYNWQRRLPARIYNNGHAPPFEAQSQDVFLFNPPGRFGIYIFKEWHLHLGKTAFKGSEHKINDMFYPMEVHAIFYNIKYHPDQASEYPDGIVVIGTMIKVNGILQGGNENVYSCKPKFATNLDNLMKKYIPQVRMYTFPNTNEAIISEGISPMDVLPHSDSAGYPFFRTYYTYEGSLTTPPCHENLKWFVNACPITISYEAYAAYASVLDVDSEEISVHGIRRPVQRDVGSKAMKSFPGHFQ